ncbi:MAG: outer membrane beta-barrel protein [Bryobacterales bacterium]
MTRVAGRDRRELFPKSLVLLFAAAPLAALQAGVAVDPAVTPEQRAALLSRVETLEAELQEIKAQLAAPGTPEPTLVETESEPAEALDIRSVGNVGLLMDGYYSYNFNQPADGLNPLRAYDRRHNSFGLNQAALVFDREPEPEQGRRFGVRVDLMYGQATDALQGSPLNELRPDMYRPVFQAYGTYVAPVGSGLTIDFGKWASALGLEGNYTLDQVNYSRSYLFNFLPFYHFGFRARYDFTDQWGASYWLVNGNGQSDDFNGLKSNAFFGHWKPSPRVETNLAYYTGNENNTRAFPGEGRRALDGKLHIVYDQTLWSVTDRLSLGAELAYINNRETSASPPSTALGGGALASFDLNDRWSLGARYERVSDGGGFLTGRRQLLQEATFTLSQRVAERFLVRYEVRRDASSRAFFTTDRAGLLARQQTTALLGLTWWLGREGGW